MKKHIIKLAALSMSLMLFASPLIACGKKKEETVSYETWWTSEESSEESSEPSTSTTPVETSATTEPSETTPAGLIENPFTGLYEVDEANAGKKGSGVEGAPRKRNRPMQATSHRLDDKSWFLRRLSKKRRFRRRGI